MREHRSSHNKLARLGVEGGYLIPYLEDQGSGQDTGGGNPVADAIDTLVRRRYLIAGLFLLVVAITVAYTLSLPRLYEARSMVLVDLDQGSGRTAPVTSLTENIQFIRGKRSLRGELILLEISELPVGEESLFQNRQHLGNISIIPG